MRTAFGSIFAQTQLPMRTGTVRNRAVNDFLSLGWDLRTLASATVSPSTPRTDIEVSEANAYVEARMIQHVLDVYVDETLGPGPAGTREVFALMDALPLNGYVKAGKFMLPYGLRLQDDYEFIRQQTGFTYKTPDQGVEVGFEPGPWSFFAAVSNGTAGAAENNNGKELTSSLVYVHHRFRLGASASRNQGTGLARTDVYGGFGGVALGPLTLLGELDHIADRDQADTTVGKLAGFVEGDLLARRGVNLKVTYGYFDQNLGVPNDGHVRMRFGVELFPVAFLRAAAFYTADMWIPQAHTPDRVSVELHAYF